MTWSRRFKYALIEVKRGMLEDHVDEHIMQALKIRGEQGWEAISVVYTETGAKIFLKQEISDVQGARS
jgi:hypothetical protein